jgi:hypothetical protein
MRFRGLLIKVTLDEDSLRVDAEVDSLNRSVKVGVGNQVREIRSGESYIFDLGVGPRPRGTELVR